MGFHRHQYSDYHADNTFGANAWFSSIFLKAIRPPMKLETTVLGLKVQYYSNLHLLDVTQFVRIGGVFSTHLHGPIPATLLPPGVGIIGMNGGPPIQPFPINFPLPKYTRVSINTVNSVNWRT